MTPEIYDKHVAWFRNYAAEASLIDGVLRARRPGSCAILELGCGTGNLMLALFELGHVVSGLDKDTEMVRATRQKLAETGFSPPVLESFEIGEERKFDFAPQDVVVATFSLAFNFLSREQLRCFFHTASRLLTVDGLFIVNGFNLEKTKQTHPDGEWVVRGVNPLHGNRLPTFDRVDYTGSRVKIVVQHRAEWLEKPLVTTYDLQTYAAEQLADCALTAGFKLLQTISYPQPGPYSPTSSDEYFLIFSKAAPALA
jgi:cyclopropane fatty-acyl-phospholipid synthase-like methyltransferase